MTTSLLSVIDHFSSVRVLVVGDVMLDRFQYGKVDRISPEAPVPVFRPVRGEDIPGGAGNTAANLTALGCRAVLLSRTGTDKNASCLTRLLGRRKVETHIVRQQHAMTTVKTRFVAGNKQILRIDEEDAVGLDPRLTECVVKCFKQNLPTCDIVVLSDYGKGVLSSDLTPRLIAACRRAGKPVIVDPKGVGYKKYAGASLIKPNLKEFSEVTGRRFDPSNGNFRRDLIDAAKKLAGKFSLGGVLVTLSENGMLYVPAIRSVANAIYLPTQAREVFDVSGAGDTSGAALAAALGAGATMGEALRIANAAAGIVVGKLGTATVSQSELKAEIADVGEGVGRKVRTIEELVPEIASLKRRGRKIGFTNGCFDCCHLGHLSSLCQARKLCDVLVVGVNSDKWIRANKGPGRPLQDQATRMTLLASLECVDFVVVFESQTALPLVRKLKPDVIAKEGYALDNWPEGRYVKSIGGEAVTLQRVAGYSTTELATRAKMS